MRSHEITAAPLIGHPFNQRYALERFASGIGVLVDLETGAFFQLNNTSSVICEALRTNEDLQTVVAVVCERLSLSKIQAAEAVQIFWSSLFNSSRTDASAGPLHYRVISDESAALFEDEAPLFSIDLRRRTLRLATNHTESRIPIDLCLRSLSPKLLAALEIPILHAAACEIGGALIAFSGKSGAGKTTSARSFARAGADLLSEDVLVLSVLSDSIDVFRDGERAMRRWASQVASELRDTPGRVIDFTSLADVARGKRTELSEIWLIDASRRGSNELRLASIEPSAAVVALLGSGILATSRPDHWREFLTRSRFVAEHARVFDFTPPSGLDQLDRAVRHYMRNSAS